MLLLDADDQVPVPLDFLLDKFLLLAELLGNLRNTSFHRLASAFMLLKVLVLVFAKFVQRFSLVVLEPENFPGLFKVVLELDQPIVVVLVFKFVVHLLNLSLQTRYLVRVLEVGFVFVHLPLHALLFHLFEPLGTLCLEANELSFHLVDQAEQFSLELVVCLLHLAGFRRPKQVHNKMVNGEPPKKLSTKLTL